MLNAQSRIRALPHPPWMLRTAALFGVVCAAALAAACGTPATSRQQPAPTATPAPHAGPVLQGSFSVYEAERLDGSFRASLQLVNGTDPTAAPQGTTCAAYASGNGSSFAAPVFDTTIGNYSVYFQLMLLKSYHGPGTYTAPAKSDVDGTLALDIGVANGTQSGAVSIFRSKIGGSTTLTVQRDGSGSIDFSTWGSDEVRGTTGSAGDISGTIRWSCA